MIILLKENTHYKSTYVRKLVYAIVVYVNNILIMLCIYIYMFIYK